MPSERKGRPPNLLKCKECGWTEDFTPRKHDPRGNRCPECEAPAVVRCGSRLCNKPGRRCEIIVAAGNRCKKHGYDSPKGTAHPGYVNGTYSKYSPARQVEERARIEGHRVPERFREAYERAFNDPLAQDSHRHELAMLRAVTEEVEGQMGTAESGAAWRRLRGDVDRLESALRGLRRAQRDGDQDRAGELLADVLGTIEDEVVPTVKRGAGEAAQREELVRLYERASKMKRIKRQGEDMVPAATIGVLTSLVARVLTEYVEDPRRRSDALMDIRRAALPGWTRVGDEKVVGEGAGE